MAKINFKAFELPTDISGRQTRTADVRESFADLLYKNVNGVAAGALAMKIYRSEGELELSGEEAATVVKLAEQLCTPIFIDALKKALGEGEAKK